MLFQIWIQLQIWIKRKMSKELETIELNNAPSPGADRTLAILEVLFKNIEGLTIMDIVRETGIAQNTANRIAQTLELRGYLERHPETKRFMVTDKIFNMSSPRVDGKSLVVTAYESMCNLRDLTGESVQLINGTYMSGEPSPGKYLEEKIETVPEFSTMFFFVMLIGITIFTYLRKNR